LVPGLSPLLGTAHPRDLGVRYSATDAQRAHQKLSPRGDGRVVALLTEAEVSALLADEAQRAGGRFGRLQVRIHPGGEFELSGTTAYRGRSLPLYARGMALVTPGAGASVELGQVALGGLPLPAALRNELQQFLRTSLDAGLDRVQGLSLDGLDSSDGQVRVVARVPPQPPLTSTTAPSGG